MVEILLRVAGLVQSKQSFREERVVRLKI